jgi:hypothetical protein
MQTPGNEAIKISRTGITIASLLVFTIFSTRASSVTSAPCDTVSYDFLIDDIVLCYDGDCATLETTEYFLVYEWSTGDSSSSIMVCRPGKYYVTVTDDAGCDGEGIFTVIRSSNPSSQVTIGFCVGDSAIFNGTAYSLPGTYVDTLISTIGCSEILILTVYEIPLTSITITQSICSGDSALIGGIWYTESGIYTSVSESSDIDCDTVFTIIIEEHTFIANDLFFTMCPGDSLNLYGNLYTDFGIYVDIVTSQTDACDTLVTIEITEALYYLPEIYLLMCHNDSLPCFFGPCLETGIYYDTINGLAGACDSVLTINVTVEMPTPLSFDIEPDMGTSSGRIELEDTSGFTYLWSTGALGLVISNLSIGEYTVTITSISGCQNVITYTVTGPIVDLDVMESNDKLEPYPNPFLNDFNLSIPDEDLNRDVKLIVLNPLGQIVHSSELSQERTVRIGSGFQPGLYIIFLISQEEVLASTLVVKTE